jgi:hypothetical protein
MARKLDLDDLLDRKQPIYVRNGALKVGLLMVIAIKDKYGKNQQPLKLPPIDLPVNVSAQFSADSIRESTDLRKVLGNGTVLLVDPDQAVRELSTKEAKEQTAALSLSVYADTAESSSTRDALEKLSKKNNPTVINAHQLLKKGQQTIDASLKVRGVIASFESKEKSSKDTLMKLKQMKPQLVEADLTFIISSCKSEVTIREFAEETLSALQANPEVGEEQA